MFYFQWVRFFDVQFDSPFSSQKLQAAPPSGVAPIRPSPTRPTPRARALLGPTRSSKTTPSSALACKRRSLSGDHQGWRTPVFALQDGAPKIAKLPYKWLNYGLW